MATKTEVEHKYEVPVDFALPDLTRVSGVAAVDEPVEHHLDATYYDPPELRLAAHRTTLRQRSGGYDAGWHLKRPTQSGDRTEAQAPPGRKVPRTFAQQLRAISHGVPLKPVARIRTRRLERSLRD